MILQLLTDDKFTDYAIKQFSAPEMDTELVLIPSNNMLDKVSLISKCHVIYPNTSEFDCLLNSLGDYSAIVLNGLFWGGWQTKVLESVPTQVKVAWYFWGGDLYNRIDIHDKHIAPFSLFLSKLYFLKHGTKNRYSWQVAKKLLQRIDYCLTGEEEEFLFAKDYIGNPNFKMLWYTCYSIEETLGELINEHSKGKDILVGHCACIENHHLETLLKLRFFDLDGRKLIVPLSYGDAWIRNLISRFGKFLFGSAFVPMMKFLPREDYNRSICRCSTFIMPAYLPQAQGNIITSLWLGMRVYLSERSLAYSFFKRIGAIVFSFETEFNTYKYAPLSEEEILHNREILREMYSKESVMQSVKNVVAELSTPKKLYE